MDNFILMPPVAFLIVLGVSLFFSYLTSFLAFRRGKGESGALEEAYTGGELVKSNRVQPDYQQFFPFAFYFMILHVVTLMLATVPKETLGSFVLAVIYLLGAIIGLLVLFRRK